MMRKAKIALIGAGLVSFIIVGVAAQWIRKLDFLGTVTWGGPSLCVSERDYFMARMACLFDAWDSRRSGDREPAGDEGYLVVDVENRLIWLEPQGLTSQCEYVQLPAALSWKLCYRLGNDVMKMPSLVCLRPFHEWHGALALVGRGTDRTSFTCILHGPFYGSMESRKGKLDPNTLSSSGAQKGLPTILITDEQRLHQIAQNRPSTVTSEDALSPTGDNSDPLTRRKTIWRNLQKPLYQALEQEVIQHGYEVKRISVQPSPDYSAGLAGISLQGGPTGRVSRFWSFVRRRSKVPVPVPALPDLFFIIDAVSDGRWRCRTAQRPENSRSGRMQIGFDFYIELPKSMPEAVPPRAGPELDTPQWCVDINNGTRVELIGVCANLGTAWWAPDGSVLDNWPGYFISDGYDRIVYDLKSSSSAQRVRRRGMSSGHDGDGERTAVILRVPSSVGFGNSAGHSYSGFTRVYYGSRSPLRDRSGLSHSPGQYIVMSFDALDQDSISHALGIRVGGPFTRPETIRLRNESSGGRHSGWTARPMGLAPGPPMRVSDANAVPPGPGSDPSLQWIQLKNLSLRPGRHTEFQMSVTEGPGDVASVSQVQVRP